MQKKDQFQASGWGSDWKVLYHIQGNSGECFTGSCGDELLYYIKMCKTKQISMMGIYRAKMWDS